MRVHVNLILSSWIFATLLQVQAAVVPSVTEFVLSVEGVRDDMLSSSRVEVEGLNDQGRAGGVAQGWLGRWLSMGGEGSVIVHIGEKNVSLPHRPAAFPSHIPTRYSLPVQGELKSFKSILSTPTTPSGLGLEELACLPPLSPVGRPPSLPSQDKSRVVALIERGGCDFATKVIAAQDRGSSAVIVGDSVAHLGESDEEGKMRESLITMFSPEDTASIFIPSVFVSRASYLLLRDLLANHTGSADRKQGLWIDIGEAADEGGALTSLLSFALLMPSLFLLATIAIHRIRVARQREADRAPPMIVLSLPERVWTPDIVWEKDDSSSDRSVTVEEHAPSANHAESSTVSLPPPPPISPSDVRTPPALAVDVLDPLAAPPTASGPSKRKERVRRQYFSKDECAICMDAFEKGDVVRILPCGHVFHKDECDEWLLKWRKLCPTCRADVTLPAGANAKGTTLTPVAPVGSPDPIEADDLPTGPRGLGALWRRVRTRLFGYPPEGEVRLEEEEGERTPLVRRSPLPSPSRERRTSTSL